MTDNDVLLHIKETIEDIKGDVKDTHKTVQTLSVGQAEVKITVKSIEKQINGCQSKSREDHNNLFARMRTVETGKIGKKELWLLMAIFSILFGVMIKVL